VNISVFGKTMENIEKRVDVKLVTNRQSALRCCSKPNFYTSVIFSESLVATHITKTQIKYDKPIYFGICILDISKTLLYDFHYNYMKPKYACGAACGANGESNGSSGARRIKLLFTDTDSLCYEIKTKDIYKDIADDVQNKFDTSDYLKGHPAVMTGFKIGCNNKVIGMFKDEAAGKQITEFVGLRARC
jgi:hypothetical protein